VVGPDEYDFYQKAEALFHAEGRLELDLNSGEPFDPAALTKQHVAAVLELATHHLTQAASSPSSVTLGELDDGGSEKMDYSDQFLNNYNTIIESLAKNDDGGGVYFGATNTTGSSTTTNRRDPLEMDNRYPFRRDHRFQDDHLDEQLDEYLED
jgi:hypothetical protein